MAALSATDSNSLNGVGVIMEQREQLAKDGYIDKIVIEIATFVSSQI